MKKKVFFMTLLLTLLMASIALGAQTGWKKKSGKIYYYLASEDGTASTTKATGLQNIDGKYYYFNESGVLQTGWVATEQGYRYFEPAGKLGTKGVMYTGLKKIGKYTYYFYKKTTPGVVRTGLLTIKKKTYYFSTSTKLGVRGRCLRKKWMTLNGEDYYFGSDGVMVKSKWVNSTYYVDASGKKLKNTVTPDGYLVDKDGKKASSKKVNGWVKIDGKWHYYSTTEKKLLVKCWKTVSGKRYYLGADGVRVTGWQKIGKYKYYFSSKGVMKTGWQTIGGKKYYFGTNGRMKTNTEVDGYEIGSDGVAVPTASSSDKPQILIIAGHGQGDPGATSSWGYESNYTRQFAQLIYNELKKSDKVDVTYYKNGSTSYDCYQQNAKTFGSAGLNMSSSITGSGAVKTKVKNGLKTNSNLPDFTQYDYVLEIHFNAMGAGKNPGGDGKYTGVGFYINSYKSKYTLEKNILAGIVKCGFKQWGSGVYASSTLFNARICQELGVSYGLLETAFIDDGDDMKFYTNNKSKMAAAVAGAIVAYYS